MSQTRGPRGPYSTGVARRREIVDEATRVFGSIGYNGGSLRQIAQRIGISPAAINRHFTTKADLLDAVLARWDEEVAEYSDPNAEGLAYWHRFRSILRYHEEHPGKLAFFLAVAVEATAEDHPAGPFMRERYSRTLRQLQQSLRLVRDRGEISALTDREIEYEAREFIAFIDGIELQYLLQGEFGLVESFDRYWAERLRSWGVPADAQE